MGGKPLGVDAIKKQIETLKAAGMLVDLLGVGGGVTGANDVNAQLRKIAAETGADFTGTLAGTAPGAVHSSNYGAALAAIQASQASGGAPRTSHNDNSVDNDVNVHTINVHLGGGSDATKAGAAAASAMRARIVYPADTGLF
jgi:hypothetical protein